MKLRTMVVAAAILLAGGTGAAVATVPAGAPSARPYAPNGHLTNLVMADIGGGVIELRAANRVYLPAAGLERLRLGQ
jgi:hypothetical protein